MFYSLRLLETLKVIITLNSKFSILNLKRLSIKKPPLYKAQSSFVERRFCITTVCRRCCRR